MTPPRLLQLESRELPAVSLVAGLADGRLRIAGREVRPIPGWYGPLSVAEDGDRVFVGAGAGGGSRVEVLDARTGEPAGPGVIVFEPSFRGGVEVAARAGRVFVGAGDGGGPVVAELRAADLAELSRVYVGDPGSRVGVSGLAVAEMADPPPKPAPVAFLAPTNHPADPADPATVARIAAELLPVTASDAARLTAAGRTVFAFNGPGITTLPEFAHLAGVQTPNPADGTRTYDQVFAAALENAYVGPSAVPSTLHETGHVLQSTLTNDEFNRYRIGVHSVVKWDDAYLAASFGESFAESYARFRKGGIIDKDPADDALIRAYFAEVLGPNRTDL